MSPTQTQSQLNSSLDEDIRLLLPQGDDFPDDIPADIFRVVLETYASCERIDMRALAGKLGIARRTLYRKARDRNYLLGEVHWYFSRLYFVQGLQLGNEQGLCGAARVVAVFEHFMNMASQADALIKSLRDEPENTLRLITTKHGPVHGRVVGFVHRLLQHEQQRGHFNSSMPLDALAFAIVRIGESFLYSEVLTGEETELKYSVEMISRLLRPDQIKVAS